MTLLRNGGSDPLPGASPSPGDPGDTSAVPPVICFDHVSKYFILQIDRPRSFLEVAVGLFRQREPHQQMTALEDVSFKVQPGETVGIIGANGAGKSTLLKLITRILEPSSGHITVNGRISALLELGAGFHPDLTGRENVYLNGSILGLSRREMDTHYASIVHFAELERFIDTPVKHYSSGMYMRLGFSIAIHVDPDILLIDEILAVGDQAFQQKCLDRIERFRRQGKAIVFVSHDLSSVATLCDRVLWLEDGRVMGQGPAREIIDRYLLSVYAREDAALAAEHAQLGEPAPSVAPGEPQEQNQPPAAEAPAAPQPDRWGNREVEIAAVRMLKDGSHQAYVFDSGEPVIIEIDYRVNQPVEPPVFGVAIIRNDGVRCYGTNTSIESVSTAKLPPRGTIRITFDRFAFVEGNYSLDVAVHHENEKPYDYFRGSYEFSVRSQIRDSGVFRPGHRWQVPGNNSVEHAEDGAWMQRHL